MTCTLDGKRLKERNFLLYPICRLCTTMKLLVLTMHKAVKEIHWDYSIQKVGTNNFYSQVAMHQKNEWVSAAKGCVFCCCIALSEEKSFKHQPWYDVFISDVYMLSYFLHLNTKIGGERLWKYIIRPIKSTNESTSQCKSQYYEINVSTVHVLNTSTKIWCNWALNSSRI